MSKKRDRINRLIAIHTTLRHNQVSNKLRMLIIEEIEGILAIDHIRPSCSEPLVKK